MIDVVVLLCFLTATAAIAYGVGRRMGGSRIQTILVLGVLARALGSTVRVEVTNRFYHGVGDSYMYFNYGSLYSDYLLEGNIAAYTAHYGRWWGTQFVRWFTGGVLIVTGENYRTAMFVFSLFSMVGLAAIAQAYRNAVGEKADAFAAAALLWPSLCFWPASIGKDTLMILALGLATYGYVGYRGRVFILPLTLGVVLAACIRPHIAGALATAVAFAEWTRQSSSSQPRRIALLAVVLTIAGTTVYTGLSQLTAGDLDLDAVTGRVSGVTAMTQRGGSEIQMSSGLAAVPMAFVNVLLRPFPWEAHHVFALLASAEIWLLWALLFQRRRKAFRVLRQWRQNRLTAFAVPALVLITLLYGVAFSNLGIIARQRVIVLPFLFLIVAMARSNHSHASAHAAASEAGP